MTDLKDLKELAVAATESLIARELLKAEANPKTVLELIARVEAAEGAVGAKDAAIVAGAETIHKLKAEITALRKQRDEAREALGRLSGFFITAEQQARQLVSMAEEMGEETGISDMKTALEAVLVNDDGSDFLMWVGYATRAADIGGKGDG
jgi:predicted house-cleaning NTP pyrophosphatase (Maf/HAM1 superfamily)